AQPWQGHLPLSQELPMSTHPEVLGVHVQLVAVQLGQLGEGVLDAVQVLDGLPEGGEHLLAVGLHLGVTDDGGGAGQVPEGGEEPLGPGVDDQQPGERHRHGHTDAPAGDELLLLGCPLHHGAGRWVVCWLRRKSGLLLPKDGTLDSRSPSPLLCAALPWLTLKFSGSTCSLSQWSLLS
uniref:Uncharacterized protein n=1 Tax=Cyanistes caeruleus TaxID=156563 RepID=A0A8C0UAH7_CYACU